MADDNLRSNTVVAPPQDTSNPFTTTSGGSTKSSAPTTCPSGSSQQSSGGSDPQAVQPNTPDGGSTGSSLSNAAKIGIGVSVAVITIIVGLGWVVKNKNGQGARNMPPANSSFNNQMTYQPPPPPLQYSPPIMAPAPIGPIPQMPFNNGLHSPAPSNFTGSTEQMSNNSSNHLLRHEQMTHSTSSWTQSNSTGPPNSTQATTPDYGYLTPSGPTLVNPWSHLNIPERNRDTSPSVMDDDDTMSVSTDATLVPPRTQREILMDRAIRRMRNTETIPEN